MQKSNPTKHTSSSFNQRSGARSPRSSKPAFDSARGNKQAPEKPPRLGLHDGPKPPAGIGQIVKKQIAASNAARQSVSPSASSKSNKSTPSASSAFKAAAAKPKV